MLATIPPIVLAIPVSAAAAAAVVAIFPTTSSRADTCPLADLVPLDATNPSITVLADLAPSDEKHGLAAARLNGTDPAIDAGTVAWMETRSFGNARTTTAQSSAARRSAQPPALKPAGGYAGAVMMTGLMCLVAFGIGSILGWIWPDGLRSEW